MPSYETSILFGPVKKKQPDKINIPVHAFIERNYYGNQTCFHATVETIIMVVESIGLSRISGGTAVP